MMLQANISSSHVSNPNQVMNFTINKPCLDVKCCNHYCFIMWLIHYLMVALMTLLNTSDCHVIGEHWISCRYITSLMFSYDIYSHFCIQHFQILPLMQHYNYAWCEHIQPNQNSLAIPRHMYTTHVHAHHEEKEQLYQGGRRT